MTFFINQFLPIFPIVVFWLVYLCSFVAYYYNKQESYSPSEVGAKGLLPPFLKKEWLHRFVNLKVLIIFTTSFRVFYAGLLSIMQYYIWSQNEFTQLFINSPINSEVPFSNFLRENLSFIFNNKLGYFLFYSWGRFWISALLAIGIAFTFYALLKALKKYNDRFFIEGETELGLLLALIAGWPNFVVFVPLVFLAVLLVSIFRSLYLKEIYTTLGAPMLLAALTTMIFGSNLISVLNLTVLKI